MMLKAFTRAALTVGMLAASGSSVLANDALQTLANDPAAWTMPLGNYSATRYSTLDQINKDNIRDLVPAWNFSTGVLRGHEGSPLVIGTTMYVHTPFPNLVYALDLTKEGAIKWKYEPIQDAGVIPVMCCDTVNRGVAYAPAADGQPALVILAQADTTVVALDADTGKPVWTVKNGDPEKGETSTAAPLVVKDKVLIGNAGGEFGVRGHLTAYSLKDGAQAWRAYSTGPDADMLIDPVATTSLGKPIGEDSSLKSWSGDQWQIGGGTTWGWFSYDPEMDLIFYGTGNPSTWNPAQRPGDNKWATSVFARDPDTGMAKWVYQQTPHDEWDYDSTNEVILTDVEVEGQTRKALVQFGRNGFAYTMDRSTGELLVVKKYDPSVNWATEVVMDKTSPDYGRPIVVPQYSTEQNGEDTKTTGICPAALGTKDQQPAAYSPKTKLFYVPTNHVCMDYEPFRVAYSAGQPYVGSTVSMYPTPDSHGGMGNFVAWDASTGELVWSMPEQFSVWSGALATAGDIVFYGTLEGYLKAVDATTGEELYRFKTASGIIGNVMTYEVEGQQYVAVLSGIGGWAGIGLAAGLTDPNAGLGAAGGYASLAQYTTLGGQLTVFTVPNQKTAAR